MATFEPPSAEKLIFSDKTFACLIDCTPKPMDNDQDDEEEEDDDVDEVVDDDDDSYPHRVTIEWTSVASLA